MGDLVVRKIDDRIVRALKMRAARHGRSAEAEHREILEHVLVHIRPRSLAEVLSSMPELGCDEDFERVQDDSSDRVFD